MKLGLAFAVLLISSLAAGAQQQPPPDPAALQQAISMIQMQRNKALDEAVLIGMENARLKDQVAELQKQIDALKAAKPDPK
jgi:hypothetical protein